MTAPVRASHKQPTQTMSTTKSRVIQPYLFFNGRCEEAVKFYQKALGAEVQMMMRYKESPEPPPPGHDAAQLGRQNHARRA